MSQPEPAKYKQLPSGRHKLIYLGNLYQQVNQGWKLAAYLQDEGGNIRPHRFRIEALPDLRIGQHFQDGTPEPEPIDKTFRVPLPSESKWRTEAAGKAIPQKLWHLGSKPELCQQNVFVFTQGAREFVVPVLELARALLVHTKAVCKQMMMPNGLDGLAIVQKDSPLQGEAEIRFRPDAPLYLIENETFRKHLIWMLLHPVPAAMFSSIYSRFISQNNQSIASKFQRFVFDMAAPDFSNVWMEYSGPIYGNRVFVREITGFSGLPDCGYKALCSHPHRREAVKADESGKPDSAISLTVPENMEIDEKEDDSSTSNHTRFVDIRPVNISYQVEPDIEIVYSGNSQSSQGKSTNIKPANNAETSTGSLGDPDKNSKLESVEYGQPQSLHHDQASGLLLFTEVVEQIASENNWRFTIDYYELPSVSRTQFRLLGDRPRQAGLASFYLPGGVTKHLLEVQISDARYLSTLLLTSPVLVTKEACKDRVSLLLWALVKGTGHWKAPLLSGLKGKLKPLIVEKIRHPKRLYEKTPDEACQVWVEKLQKILRE